MVETIMKIAGIRFRDNWKVYDFDATDLELSVGDSVIVDSDRGLGIATVVRVRKPIEAVAAAFDMAGPEAGPASAEEATPAAAPVAAAPAPKLLRKLVRKANEDDLSREKKNREREAEAFAMSQDMIAERELPMKLIRVEYSLDATRATFFFFSETRIDFRDLVKDLAYKLRSRIEMRQIGVRDVARLIGGFGPCGRELCCASFLKNFEPVSIRMAKKQDMVLNPAKISGVCGRLLCCLSYEYEMYEENKKDLASMRQAVIQVKRDEEERRITEAREDEERRQAEERKRQEERKKPQEQRREKPREKPRDEAALAGGARTEKRREPQQDKKQRGRGGKPKDRQQPKPKQEGEGAPQQQQRPQQQPRQQPQPQPQSEQPQEQPKQEGLQPQQQGEAGEKSGKKNKRRFWRNRKKKPGQGDKPQGGPGGGGGQAG
jgi:cell fate regulator YaaT (PSP1 superfamily)